MTDNLPIRIYVNKWDNRITLIIKEKHLTPKTMKLLWSTEKRIDKDKNDENVPHLKIILRTPRSTVRSNKIKIVIEKYWLFSKLPVSIL